MVKLYVYIISILLLLNTVNTNSTLQAEIEEVEIELCVFFEENSIEQVKNITFTKHIFSYRKDPDYTVYISEDQQPPEHLS
jgi:hypothetical protein